MTSAQANGITIEYEVVGSQSDPPMLLVMGFGGQLVFWPRPFVEQLAQRGFQTIIYDNRDVGLSTKFDNPGYSLDDMADDGMGLLDALGIESAHVVGASMGGYIAQRMAVRYAARVRTLCSVMSTTGDPTLPPPRPEIAGALVPATPASREEAIDQAVASARLIGSPGFPFDEDAARRRAAVSYDRCFHPAGRLGHAFAVATAPDHTAELAELRLPTLVIHGGDDPRGSPLGGEATARAIPGARLVMIPGMGHDLPEGTWTTVVDAIVANADRAGT